MGPSGSKESRFVCLTWEQRCASHRLAFGNVFPQLGSFRLRVCTGRGGGVFGKRLFKLLSAPGAAPFHPLPLRKDVLGKDFKVLLSKGKSHLESFSQKEKETNYLI